jgi:hypothetical protein
MARELDATLATFDTYEDDTHLRQVQGSAVKLGGFDGGKASALVNFSGFKADFGWNFFQPPFPLWTRPSKDRLPTLEPAFCF